MPGDVVDGEDVEDWIDEAYGFWWAAAETSRSEGSTEEKRLEIPRSERAKAREKRLEMVRGVLEDLRRPQDMSDAAFKQLVRYAAEFFVKGDALWRKGKDGRHQLVPAPEKRIELLAAVHDSLGHKGVFSVRSRMLDRFWWPNLDDDVKWYVRTCHECQVRQRTMLHIPPTVAAPAPLFRKAYIDTMLMPKAGGFRYIVQARCSLTAYPEFRKMRQESGRTIGSFIYEEILCRWGALQEIVSDNGTAFVAALDYLSEKYHINHIRISPYNSQANGIVERRHLDVRDALMKMAGGQENKWPEHTDAVFWAERVTVNRVSGHSPYWMAHGVEPLMPFDLTEATYMLPPPELPMTSGDLLARRARLLQKRPEDLAAVHERVLAARYKSAADFEKRFANTIKNKIYEPGALVMVRNSRVHMELNRKTKPRYLGPMVVVRRVKGGAYILADLDGAISKSRYAAFRIISYFLRPNSSIPITSILDLPDEEIDKTAQEIESLGAPDEVDLEAPDADEL